MITGLVFAVAALVLLAHAWTYLPYIADDALISLRYAQRLLAGEGLTWTDGERVEGYSNLLWVLACAGVGALGFDLILAARILGLVCMGLALGAVVAAYRPARLADTLPALAGGLGLALTGPVAVWAVGGMEQPLLAALLAWALVCCYPLLERDRITAWDTFAPGVLLALLCLTRPDGALLAGAVGAGLVLARGLSSGNVRLALFVGLPSVLAVVAQMAFRLLYYGDWLPNTARVKVGFSAHRLATGIEYVTLGLAPLAPLVVLALAAGALAGCDRTARRRVLLLAVPLAAWLAYVVFIGGDIFPARRHFVPAIVLLALLAAEGARAALARGWAGTAWAVAPILLVVLGVMQQRDHENLHPRYVQWEWDGAVTGNVLRQAFGSARPLLAVDPAGCLPYFSKLPALDMLGLNDRHIATHRPPDFGSDTLGHELGDGRYVLSREPDLVVFNGVGGAEHAAYRSGREMQADPRFAKQYQLVRFAGEHPHPFTCLVWVRRESERIGIRREADRVVVPGFLLAAHPGGVARLDAQGRIGAQATRDAPAVLRGLALPAGQWRMSVVASGAVRAHVRPSRDAAPLAAGAGELVFTLPGEATGTVELEITPAGGDLVHVRQVVLRR